MNELMKTCLFIKFINKLFTSIAEHCADAEVIYKFLEVNEIDKTTVVSGDDLFVHQSISSEKFRSLAVDEAVEFKVEVDNASRLKTVEVSGPEGEDVMVEIIKEDMVVMVLALGVVNQVIWREIVFKVVEDTVVVEVVEGTIKSIGYDIYDSYTKDQSLQKNL
ncbi:unnamed protein product [Arabidopsis lyrata]|uniref:Uncharacterized protein n=1 Tax=Arabidopsis lyrata subsp. lyrata TaxID=81972 RepID=D7LPS6_ARALL|nr:hypothetical protein ARALYDRAFT_347204 [Arabidopsis lyrata subsp. lyrata]CAH8267041.1 unnamed protein product [Arabidopsis lyrata]